jgi:hypothetical protein
LFVFETGLLYVAQAGLELTMLLHLLPRAGIRSLHLVFENGYIKGRSSTLEDSLRSKTIHEGKNS